MKNKNTEAREIQKGNFSFAVDEIQFAQFFSLKLKYQQFTFRCSPKVRLTVLSRCIAIVKYF